MAGGIRWWASALRELRLYLWIVLIAGVLYLTLRVVSVFFDRS